jgi:hypothetical protein
MGSGGNDPVNDRQRALCERALKAWGVQAQLDMMIEEMAELTKAIIKYRRGIGDKLDLLREGVDVQLMTMQLETMFPPSDWEFELIQKLARVQDRLDKPGTSRRGSAT